MHFVDFLAAHLVQDNQSLATDLPNKEVITVTLQKEWEMYFNGASRNPTG